MLLLATATTTATIDVLRALIERGEQTAGRRWPWAGQPACQSVYFTQLLCSGNCGPLARFLHHGASAVRRSKPPLANFHVDLAATQPVAAAAPAHRLHARGSRGITMERQDKLGALDRVIYWNSCASAAHEIVRACSRQDAGAMSTLLESHFCLLFLLQFSVCKSGASFARRPFNGLFAYRARYKSWHRRASRFARRARPAMARKRVGRKQSKFRRPPICPPLCIPQEREQPADNWRASVCLLLA